MSSEEFSRRFGHHVPEPRTVRIRHIGFLAGVCRKKNILKARAQTNNFEKKQKEIDQVVSKILEKLEKNKLENKKRHEACCKCNGAMQVFAVFDFFKKEIIPSAILIEPLYKIDTG